MGTLSGGGFQRFLWVKITEAVTPGKTFGRGHDSRVTHGNFSDCVRVFTPNELSMWDGGSPVINGCGRSNVLSDNLPSGGGQLDTRVARRIPSPILHLNYSFKQINYNNYYFFAYGWVESGCFLGYFFGVYYILGGKLC